MKKIVSLSFFLLSTSLLAQNPKLSFTLETGSNDTAVSEKITPLNLVNDPVNSFLLRPLPSTTALPEILSNPTYALPNLGSKLAPHLTNNAQRVTLQQPSLRSMNDPKVSQLSEVKAVNRFVLEEKADEWFDLIKESKYMLFTAKIKENKREKINDKDIYLSGLDKLKVKRSKIPSVTHVDYSARIQTVHKKTNPKYHALVSKFHELTACPVIINTSFNIRGEPIVNTPKDAFRCFMGTEMDILVIGNCILKKEEQDPALFEGYQDAFSLD